MEEQARGAMERYRSERGHCDVPESQGQLGTWVGTQRKAYVAGSVAQYRMDRLNGIGFKWALIEQSAKVPQGACPYKAKHGDCDVPTRQGRLGNWVHKQRKTYVVGSLAQARIDRLCIIGFRWTTTWVSRQRTYYRKGKLSPDRIDRLDDIGFEWTLPRGGSKKRKAPSSTRKQSLSRKKSPSTNVTLSVGDGERGAEPNVFKREERNTPSALSLKVPSKRSDHWTESDDEVDEIGALIYDQAMRQRQSSQLLRPEDVPIKTEESEAESEIDAIFSSQRSAHQGRRNGQICL